MSSPIIKGISFGLTSGIITTLGLMIGLHATTHDRNIVLAGILIIAIADALSDAFGIHIAEESDSTKTHRNVWQATIATFSGKIVFGLTFAVPVFLLDLDTAIIVSAFWGFLLLIILSYYIAKHNKKRAGGCITEHVALAAIVIILTHLIGRFISNLLT